LRLSDYGVLYWVVVGVLALLIASPALSRVLVYPRTEFFTELWLLDANHSAEGYPYNVTRNADYHVYLGIGNHLGHCAYYVVQVKFRNQTQPAPTSFGPIENRTPSNLPSLFNLTAFVADEQVFEMPLTFSFDYRYDEVLSMVTISSLRLNDVALNMSDCTIDWDPEKNAFRGYLFFELWVYDEGVNRLQYHGRFVGLWLNMTLSE
jgi:hypothetical protein